MGFLSPDVLAFNLAVSRIEDARLIPFAVIYCEIKPKSITELASEYGVSRYKFYDLAHEMALEIFSHTQKILKDRASK